MAKITINQLQLSVIVGTKHCERNQPQNILINLSFIYNSEAAENSDNLADAIDYEAIANMIREEVGKTKFFLVEKLARFILDLIMDDARITKSTVIIYKPQAIKAAKSVSVELTYER